MDTDIRELRKHCLTMWSQAEGFAREQMPVDALARARRVLEEIERTQDQVSRVETRREVEYLRKRALAEIERYEAQRTDWNAEISARRARLEAREADERRKPIP